MGLFFWGILLYVIIIFMYVKIFLVVKKLGVRVGNKRDGMLVRRIGIMVFSNMLFFLVLIIIVFLWFMMNF